MATRKTEEAPAQESGTVMDFTETLRELRKNIDPAYIRQREGWRDRNGNVQTVDYVEWHTVADILDETAPNWSHQIVDLREFGDFVVCTVRITLDGARPVGITGSAFVLESSDLKAENSLDQPTRIAPVQRQVPIPKGEFVYTFMPQSFTVLRLPSR